MQTGRNGNELGSKCTVKTMDINGPATDNNSHLILNTIFWPHLNRDASMNYAFKCSEIPKRHVILHNLLGLKCNTMRISSIFEGTPKGLHCMTFVM